MLYSGQVIWAKFWAGEHVQRHIQKNIRIFISITYVHTYVVTVSHHQDYYILCRDPNLNLHLLYCWKIPCIDGHRGKSSLLRWSGWTQFLVIKTRHSSKNSEASMTHFSYQTSGGSPRFHPGWFHVFFQVGEICWSFDKCQKPLSLSQTKSSSPYSYHILYRVFVSPSHSYQEDVCSAFPTKNQWSLLVPSIGGRYHIIPQLAVYTTYYIPLIYCLLGDYIPPIPPIKGTIETAIEKIPVASFSNFSVSSVVSVKLPRRSSKSSAKRDPQGSARMRHKWYWSCKKSWTRPLGQGSWGPVVKGDSWVVVCKKLCLRYIMYLIECFWDVYIYIYHVIVYQDENFCVHM